MASDVSQSVWRRRLHAVVEAISTGGVSLLVENPERGRAGVEILTETHKTAKVMGAPGTHPSEEEP